MFQNYEYLAARLNLKDEFGQPNIHEAKRTWQIWGEVQDYRYEDEGRTADQNLYLKFCQVSGLPAEVVEKRIQVCQEIDSLLAETMRG